jgi:transcriptional regulator with XRE-family HTH domain
MLHEMLKKARAAVGLTQEEVSERLGVSPGSYALYEQNRRRPDPDTLVKLADIFSCTTDYLLEHIVINEVKIGLNDYGKRLGLTEDEVKYALEVAAKLKKKT